MPDVRQPTLFVPHGGGPWPFVTIPGFPPQEPLREFLTGILATLPARPRVVLVVSAHWEEEVPTLQASAAPQLLYDYSGFPPEAYQLSWPAKGSPEGVKEIREALKRAGIESGESMTRGYDHGTFVVTKLMMPAADIPTLQLSLTRDLSAARMFEVGAALAPLRDKGVFILGSGFSYHNMRGFFSVLRGETAPARDAALFDAWLAETLKSPSPTRRARLLDWEKAPLARACHPREEHLLPLMVCAGAAGDDPVTLPFHEPTAGIMTLAARFG